MTQARLAISHDWIIDQRGAERVLREFCLAFPDLSIFTLMLKTRGLDSAIGRHSIFVSPLGMMPSVERYYRYLLPWFVRGIEHFRVEGYDLLISISHSVAKGIPHPREVPHICYCLSPMRYLWEPQLYGQALHKGWRRLLLKCSERRLKKWDYESNRLVDEFVAISETVRRRIDKIYHRPAKVISPAVDLDKFRPAAIPRRGFFLIVSSLVPQKRIDIAIEAFNRNGKPLKIAGSGPLFGPLSRKAAPNIEFLGWRSDQELQDLYRQARALVFPGVEDFGLVPLEAQACGCPVIAYGEGGATETVIEGETGFFFRQLRPECLTDAVSQFEDCRLDPDAAVQNAARFSPDRFWDGWAHVLQPYGVGLPWRRQAERDVTGDRRQAAGFRH